MKVSVVVGVKNGAASLQRCLAGIAAQTLGGGRPSCMARGKPRVWTF